MPITAPSGNSKTFDPHPPGSFFAVCADVFTSEKPNKYKGQKLKNGQTDTRETITKVCLAFLTTEAIEIDGDLKPRYIGWWGTFTMGTTDYPSNLRKFLKSWWPTLTEKQLDDGFDLEKLLGQGAYLTITNTEDANGKTWANVVAAMQPPKGSSIPLIPQDFVRHADKVAEANNGSSPAPVAAAEELNDLPF